MLNVKQFYEHYGQELTPEEYMEVGDRQIYAKNDRFYVLLKDYQQDPFMWLGHSNHFDGVVFRTQSGYLASIAIFDDIEDETEKAIHLCDCLINVAN